MSNNATVENCRRIKKSLSTAWIDYKKAFDGAPHSWIIKCMDLYKIHPMVSRFV